MSLQEFPKQSKQKPPIQKNKFPMFVLKEFLRSLSRSAIMGIVNATGDSFSENEASSPASAVSRGCALAAAGADILDIGGESTRPGAENISVQEEIDRVIPVLDTLKQELPEMIFSIDTRNAETAGIALEHGAHIINDVSMLRTSGDLAKQVARGQGSLIISHSRADSVLMQHAEYCSYPDGVAATVAAELASARAEAISDGLSDGQIILDPGIGFSKTAEQCWELLRDLEMLGKLTELMLGLSRKIFLAAASGNTHPTERSGETLAVELEFISRRIGIIRTHAVRELHSAVKALDYFRSMEK